MAVLDVLSPEIKEQIQSEVIGIASDAIKTAVAKLQPRMLTKKEACEYLNISYPTFKKINSSGKIVGKLYEGSSVVRFDIEDLNKYLRKLGE